MNYSILTQLETDTSELLIKIQNEINDTINNYEKPKKGRRQGQKQTKYNYSVHFYDIFQKQYIFLFDGYTFEDISIELKNKYNLIYTIPQLKSIYANKNDRYMRINHL